MKAASAAILVLALLAPVGANAAGATTPAAMVKVKATDKPARHWLSDGLQGLSLLLPRHVTPSSHNNG